MLDNTKSQTLLDAMSGHYIVKKNLRFFIIIYPLSLSNIISLLTNNLMSIKPDTVKIFFLSDLIL